MKDWLIFGNKKKNYRYLVKKSFVGVLTYWKKIYDNCGILFGIFATYLWGWQFEQRISYQVN